MSLGSLVSTRSHSAFGSGFSKIFFLSSQPKVVRIDAQPNVAVVQYIHPLRDGSDKEFVSSAVRHLVPIKNTVPVAVYTLNP